MNRFTKRIIKIEIQTEPADLEEWRNTPVEPATKPAGLEILRGNAPWPHWGSNLGSRSRHAGGP